MAQRNNLDPLAPDIGRAVASLDAWFETMRGPDGYGGPVAHWWQDCLHFTGAGLDWRYEGIIAGYLNLFERTGQTVWLEKARRAGNDLVTGQLLNGNFPNSSFEANPKTGGTPHEAACDLALIRLAQTIRRQNVSGWEPYAQAAERNIQNHLLGQLWIPEAGYFRNLTHDPVFVPNKAATIVEALSAWMDFSDQEEWLDQYILPTLERILSCQVHAPGSRLNGAIDQAQGTGQRQGWFFPFYNARCIPALILGYRLSGRRRYLEAATSTMDFILRVRLDDGSFPQALRTNGRTYRYPQWVAGVGDILRAMTSLEAYTPPIPKSTTLEWMLSGLLPSGGMRTAHGFTRKSLLSPLSRLPDFRDLLPVTGWIDKAFRYLTSLVSEDFRPQATELGPFEEPCQNRGRVCTYSEDSQRIEMRHKGKVVYRWQKGADRAEVDA